MQNTLIKPEVEIMETEETLRDGGYLVDVVFHKVGTSITIKPEVLGVEINGNDELADFYQNFVRNAQISWLGKANPNIRKAESIAKSVHKRKIKDSLDGKHYIPKSKLAGFKGFLAEKKKEYLAVRDTLVDSYELDVRLFRRRLENDFLNETVSDDDERERIIQAIMGRVPSKEEVYDSFKIEQSYMLFAMSSELEDESDRDAVIESTNMRLYAINGNTLAVVFDKANTILQAIFNKKYTKKHERISYEIIQEIEERNIFSNSKIEELRTIFQSLIGSQSLSDYEVFMGKLYKMALDINQEHQLAIDKSVLSLAQLEFLAKTV